MDQVFLETFGPEGPLPLREPLKHEVKYFYDQVKKSNAHTAMKLLIEKITGKAASVIQALPLTTVRRGQAYLLQFINYKADVPASPLFTMKLDQMITSLNGQEAWENVDLHEPNFEQFEGYIQRSEDEKIGPDAAMSWLMQELSGVNHIALTKLPITKYLEAEQYLRNFLFYFPDSPSGKTS